MENCNLENFMGKSLMSNSIEKERISLKEDITTLEKNLVAKTTVQLRISNEDLKSYDDIIEKLPFSNKKLRKKLLRNKTNIEESSKFFLIEYEKWKVIESIKNDIITKNKTLHNVDSYIEDEITLHVEILKKNGFISDDKLTEKGLLAANIQEMHCLAMADIIQEHQLDTLEAAELAAVLSIFTSVSVKQEDSVVKIEHIVAPDAVKQVIKRIQKSYDKYYDIESFNKTAFVNDYDIHYNICELVYKWSNADDEATCYKIFEEALYYNISRGEFVKAMMKINNISNELIKIAEIQSNMALLERIKQIPDILLKSIVTNQSLYL
jgi:superfamily II RNA helicase